MMRPPAPRAKPTKDAAGGAAPDVEPAAPSADARDRAPAPPLGKTYDAPAWGGAPAREFYLDCVKGGALASRTRLDRGEGEDAPRGHVTFGRHPACDVVVEHPSTSRLHCVIQFKANGTEAYVYDCESAHGTFVNKRRVKPGVHAPIRVGDQIKLGESSRLYILDGDESLMPEEGLSAAEMKALAALEAAAEAEMQRELAALKAERAAAREQEAAAKAGSSWGMMDADDEINERQRAIEELDWRTHDGKFSDKQEKQKQNIRRKEEKISNMRLEVDRIRAKESQQDGGLSSGQSTRISAVERAIETLQEEIEDADETLNESLRVSLGLQAAVSKRRRGARANSDDEDGQSGDEDDFYDRSRTSASRKRRKESKKESTQGAAAPKTLETAATLWDKRTAIETSITETEELIKVTEEAALAERQRTAGLSADGDALDAYMDEIGASKFTSQVERLRVTLSEKVSELERVSRLLKYADPTEEFRPGSAKGDAMRKHAEEAEAKRAEEAKRRAEIAEAKRAEELEARKKRDAEMRRQAEWEEQGNLQEKRKFTGGVDPASTSAPAKAKAAVVEDDADNADNADNADDEGPVIVEDVEQRVTPTEREIEAHTAAETEPVVRDDDDGFLMPHQVRAGLEIRKPPTKAAPSHAAAPSAEDTVMSDIQRLLDASSGARFDAEAAADDSDWTAPANQSGDGASALNKKLGY